VTFAKLKINKLASIHDYLKIKLPDIFTFFILLTSEEHENPNPNLITPYRGQHNIKYNIYYLYDFILLLLSNKNYT
jgi:hypothetical protein